MTGLLLLLGIAIAAVCPPGQGVDNGVCVDCWTKTFTRGITRIKLKTTSSSAEKDKCLDDYPALILHCIDEGYRITVDEFEAFDSSWAPMWDRGATWDYSGEPGCYTSNCISFGPQKMRNGGPGAYSNSVFGYPSTQSVYVDIPDRDDVWHVRLSEGDGSSGTRINNAEFLVETSQGNFPSLPFGSRYNDWIEGGELWHGTNAEIHFGGPYWNGASDDSMCIPCTVGGAGYGSAVDCTPTSDASVWAACVPEETYNPGEYVQCQNCTTCGLMEVATAACTATTNTGACVPCADGTYSNVSDAKTTECTPCTTGCLNCTNYGINLTEGCNFCDTDSYYFDNNGIDPGGACVHISDPCAPGYIDADGGGINSNSDCVATTCPLVGYEGITPDCECVMGYFGCGWDGADWHPATECATGCGDCNSLSTDLSTFCFSCAPSYYDNNGPLAGGFCVNSGGLCFNGLYDIDGGGIASDVDCTGVCDDGCFTCTGPGLDMTPTQCQACNSSAGFYDSTGSAAPGGACVPSIGGECAEGFYDHDGGYIDANDDCVACGCVTENTVSASVTCVAGVCDCKPSASNNACDVCTAGHVAVASSCTVPTVDSLAPLFGQDIGGTPVTISGTALQSASHCRFNATVVAVDSASYGEVVCSTPRHGPASVAVELVLGAVSAAVSSPEVTLACPSYLFHAVPNVTALSTYAIWGNTTMDLTVEVDGLFNTSSVACRFGSRSVPAFLASNGTMQCPIPRTILSDGSTFVLEEFDITLNGVDFFRGCDTFMFFVPTVKPALFIPSALPGASGNASSVAVVGPFFPTALSSFQPQHHRLCRIDNILVNLTLYLPSVSTCMVPSMPVGVYQLSVTLNGVQWSPSQELLFYGVASQIVIDVPLVNMSDNTGVPLPASAVSPRSDEGVHVNPLLSFTLRAVFSPVPRTVVGNSEPSIVGTASFYSLYFIGEHGVTYDVHFEVPGPSGAAISTSPVQRIHVVECETYARATTASDPTECTCEAGFTNYGSAQRPNCLPCPPGSFKAFAGEGPCEKCSSGTFTTKTNATTCEPCPPGSAGLTTGLLVCPLCPAGHSSSDSGASVCDPCPPGHWAGRGAFNCSACEPGTFAPSQASATCSRCLAGSFSSKWGSSKCEPCARGSVSSKGATNCSACAPGYISENEGKAAPCTPCLAGTFNPEVGGGHCAVCGPNSVSKEAAAACECIPSTFLKYSSECDACPAGGSCAGGQLAPLALPGFFKATSEQAAATGNEVLFLKCFPAESCLAGQLDVVTGRDVVRCEEGYVGERCSDCSRTEEDRLYFHLGNKCAECYMSGGTSWILITILWFMLAFVLLVAHEKVVGTGQPGASPLAALPIVISSMQVVAMVGTLDLHWPQAFSTVLGVFSAVNFNVDLVSPECSRAGLGPSTRLILKLITPVMGAGAVIFVWTVLRVIVFVAHTTSLTMPNMITAATSGLVVLSALVNLLHVTFSVVANAAMGAFTCVPLADGRVVAEQYPSVLCGTDEYYRGLFVAGIAGLIYSLLLPCGLLSAVIYQRNQLDQESTFRVLGSLYETYSREKFWWMATDYAYKLAMSAVLNIISNSVFVRTFSAMVIVVMAMGATFVAAPYVNTFFAVTSYFGFLATNFVLAMGVLFTLHEGSEHMPGIAIVAALILLTLYAIVVCTLIWNTTRKAHLVAEAKSDQPQDKYVAWDHMGEYSEVSYELSGPETPPSLIRSCMEEEFAPLTISTCSSMAPI